MPELPVHLTLYYKAFLELDHDRVHGEFSPSSIPFSSIAKYAEFFDFEAEIAHDLLYFVRGLDNFYMNLLAKEYEARNKKLKLKK